MKSSIKVHLVPEHSSHFAAINCIEAYAGHLIGGGRDGHLHFFNDKMSIFAHSHWINCLATWKDNLFSGSSDGVIKMWNDKEGRVSLKQSLYGHGDYVKCFASCEKYLFSGGLDQKILGWDVEMEKPAVSISNTGGSVYSLCCDDTVVVAGSPLAIINGWDPRMNSMAFSLKGHHDNIRALAINTNSTLIISASSDCTIKLWDVRERKCIYNYEIHETPIWSLCIDDNFNNFYSGSQDGSVYKVNMKQFETSLFAKYSSGILHISKDALCITCEDGSVNFHSELDYEKQTNLLEVDFFEQNAVTLKLIENELNFPVKIIQKEPSIAKFKLLNNKTQVLVELTDGTIQIGSIDFIKDFSSFEEALAAKNPILWVANWCSVDSKLGIISITLEEDSVFAAESFISSIVDSIEAENDKGMKVNLGFSLLSLLFRCLKETNNDKSGWLVDLEKSFATLEGHLNSHVSLIKENFSCILYALKESHEHQSEIAEFATIKWIHEAIVNGTFLPCDSVKVNFSLDPKDKQKDPILPNGANKLSAHPMLRIGKIKAYLVEKLPVMKMENLKFYCLDKELFDADYLGTIKHFVWKKSGDVLITYAENK